MIAFIRYIRVIRGQNVFVRRMGGGSAALCPLWVGLRVLGDSGLETGAGPL